MSDRVGVMSHGRLQQVGVPQEIYNNPVNGFVASFVGENNILTGEVGPGRRTESPSFETPLGTFRARLGAGSPRRRRQSSTSGPSTCPPVDGRRRRERNAVEVSPTSPSKAISSASRRAAAPARI